MPEHSDTSRALIAELQATLDDWVARAQGVARSAPSGEDVSALELAIIETEDFLSRLRRAKARAER
ncbi:MAG: hypothetical protein IRZ32_06515 [Solirubrobacteraceae bacterium]|nr:hypothetical protein [Solirubrobacteraceae bacterium]